MLAVLALELPVVLGVVGRPMEDENAVFIEQRPDFWVVMLPGAVHAVNERGAVKLDVLLEHLVDSVGVVAFGDVDGGSLRHCRVSHWHQVTSALGGLGEDRIEAPDDVWPPHNDPGRRCLSFGLHAGEGLLLEPGSISARESIHALAQGRRADLPIQSSDEIICQTPLL